MKVVIVSVSYKDYCLENQKLVHSISDGFELFSFDNQDENLGVMVIEEKDQVVDTYDEQSSDDVFKINMKKMIKQQNRMVNQRLRQNKR